MVVEGLTGGGFSATLDLGGFDQTVSSLSGSAGSSTSSGVVTNDGTSAAILTNQGGSSTFSAVIKDGARAIGLTQKLTWQYADAGGS